MFLPGCIRRAKLGEKNQVIKFNGQMDLPPVFPNVNSEYFKHLTDQSRYQLQEMSCFAG